MWKRGLAAASEGKNVFFDIIEIDEIARKALEALGPKTTEPLSLANRILVYCPFKTLPERIDERNRKAEESGEPWEIRKGLFPFVQFAQIYGPKRPDQQTLEVLERDFVLEIFEKYYPPCNEKQDRESYEEQKSANRKRFLQDLGFQPNIERVEIAPRFEGYQVINTGIRKPEECARILIGES